MARDLTQFATDGRLDEVELGWSVDLASEGMDPAMRARLAAPHTTPEGWIILEGWAARSGVQAYPERPEGSRAQYRPAEEVSAEASIASWVGRPLTIHHPSQRGDSLPLVVPDNFAAHAGGAVIGAEWAADVQHVKVRFLAQSQEAIDALTTPGGPRQLSAGYLRRLDLTAGVAPDGTPYDSVQREIIINHLAVVPRGRAGSSAAIGIDGKPKTEKPMEFVTITVNGRTLRVLKEDAEAMRAEVDALTAKSTSTEQQLREANERAKVEEAKRLTAETDANRLKEEQQLRELTQLRAQAKELLPEAQVDALTTEACKALVVESAYPELKGAAQAVVDAIYPKACERLKSDKAQVRTELGAGGVVDGAAKDDAKSAREKYLANQADAWKAKR